MKILGLIIALFIVPSTVLADCSGNDALSLYKEGCIVDARARFQSDLESARKSILNVIPRLGRSREWQALINLAWFEDEVGEHGRAVDYSNQALEIATDLRSDSMIGRSLSWLGWGYSHQGLYEMAEQFYINAVDLGAPGGKIRHPMIWGMSTQELGALKFKMGDVDAGIKMVEETFGFAKKHGVDIGVAEGGAHLAEMYLQKGNLGKAKEYADETAAAAERCSCGPLKISRAKLVLAKIAAERARTDARGISDAKGLAEQARTYAVKISDPHSEAEAMLLLARLEPAHNFSFRYDLVTKALELLTNKNSELRGLAELEVGHTLVDEGKPDLAKFYLKNGIRINKEMLRQVDKSFALVELAKVEGLKGDRREYLEKIESAYKAAKKSGSDRDAFESAQILAIEYSSLGYSKLSLKYAQAGLKILERMIQAETDSERRHGLEQRQLELAEIAGEKAAELTYGSEYPGE